MENSGRHGSAPGIAIIGGGEATRRWFLPEVSTLGGRLVALASRSTPDSLFEGLDDDEQPHLFVGPEAWRDAVCIEGVTGVVIATPNHLHAEIAEHALTNRRHVLVEKPLSTDTASVTRLCDLAKAHPGQVAAVAYKHRYLPNHARAKELLITGQLGVPVRGHATIAHAGPRAWSPSSTWFFDAHRAGGGCMIDLAVHKLDSCCWLLDDHVVAATAEFDRGVTDPVEHHATASFELSSGVAFSVDASWEAEVPVDELRIETSGGWLLLRGKEELSWAGVDGAVHQETHPASRNAVGTVASGVFAAFLGVLKGKRPVGDLPSFDHGASHVRAVMAAYASRGRRMLVAEAGTI